MISRSVFRRPLEWHIKYNQRRLDNNRHETYRLPTGSLIISKRGDRYQFYVRRDCKRTGITKEKDQVYQLARGKFLGLKGKVFRAEQDIVRRCLKNLKQVEGYEAITEFLKEVEKANLDIARIVNSKRQYDWRNHQSANPYYKEDLRYETKRGILVRSKSEKICFDYGDEWYLPMRYEFEVEIDVTEMGNVKYAYERNGRFYKKYHPDFTILLPDGSLIIWEHLGRIDKQSYREDVGERICAYLSSGFIDLDHLVLTFERDIRTPERLREIIETRIVPYL